VGVGDSRGLVVADARFASVIENSHAATTCCRHQSRFGVALRAELGKSQPEKRSRQSTMTEHPRISLAPDVLAGKPVIRGTRLSVEFIIGLLADGWGEADILGN